MIVVTPGPLTLGLDRDTCEELVATLNAEGLPARLEEPTQTRFGLPDAAPDIAIFLGQAAGQEAVSQVLRIVWQKFRGKPRQGDAGQATPRDLLQPQRRSAEARRSAVCPYGGLEPAPQHSAEG